MRILVATDGSASSMLAVTEAAELAAATSADVLILTVSPVFHRPAHGPPVPRAAARPEAGDALDVELPEQEESREILAEAWAAFQARGIHAFRLHATGDPADQIMDVAETQGFPSRQRV
jgi:nucleotide-binding universal stress UspA family protein